MLILARELRGFTQTELARQMEVTQGKISKMEDGLLCVSERDLGDIADKLRLPQSFFLRQDVKRSVFNFFYRKQASLPQKFLSQFNARVCIKQAQIERLLRKTEMDKSALPQLDPDDVPGGPNEIARQMRQFLKIPPGPIKNLIRLLEDAGIVVIFLNFGTTKLDGVSTFSNNGIPMIFINTALPPSRRIATLVHELGHLIMHRIPSDECEDQAWEFAAEFLMPANEIKNDLVPVTLDRMARLKLRWRVSIAYLLQRARSLGFITEQECTNFYIQLSRLGYRKNEPYEDFLANEYPSLEKEMIQTHLDDLGYSREEVCKLLDIDELELAEILENQQPIKLTIVE